MYQKSARYGILPACVGKPWPRNFTGAPEPAGYDYFHELINVDEGSRCGGGIAWAMMGGLGIGLPPVLNFGVPGNKQLQERVVRECLAGEKIICLCITEPGAGSDVSALATTANVRISVTQSPPPCLLRLFDYLRFTSALFAYTSYARHERLTHSLFISGLRRPLRRGRVRVAFTAANPSTQRLRVQH
jgi:hypothetical protein